MTAETLTARERSLTAAMQPEERARRLYPALQELAEELRREARLASGAKMELRELEAERVAQAAELIRILATEQFRQREAAKHFLDGRMERAELRKITRSWNGDVAP